MCDIQQRSRKPKLRYIIILVHLCNKKISIFLMVCGNPREWASKRQEGQRSDGPSVGGGMGTVWDYTYNSIPMNTKPNQTLREAELNLLIPVTTINCLYLVEYCFESEEIKVI